MAAASTRAAPPRSRVRWRWRLAQQISNAVVRNHSSRISLKPHRNNGASNGKNGEKARDGAAYLINVSRTLGALCIFVGDAAATLSPRHIAPPASHARASALLAHRVAPLTRISRLGNSISNAWRLLSARLTHFAFNAYAPTTQTPSLQIKHCAGRLDSTCLSRFLARAPLLRRCHLPRARRLVWWDGLDIRRSAIAQLSVFLRTLVSRRTKRRSLPALSRNGIARIIRYAPFAAAPSRSTSRTRGAARAACHMRHIAARRIGLLSLSSGNSIG